MKCNYCKKEKSKTYLVQVKSSYNAPTYARTERICESCEKKHFDSDAFYHGLKVIQYEQVRDVNGSKIKILP